MAYPSLTSQADEERTMSMSTDNPTTFTVKWGPYNFTYQRIPTTTALPEGLKWEDRKTFDGYEGYGTFGMSFGAGDPYYRITNNSRSVLALYQLTR